MKDTSLTWHIHAEWLLQWWMICKDLCCRAWWDTQSARLIEIWRKGMMTRRRNNHHWLWYWDFDDALLPTTAFRSQPLSCPQPVSSPCSVFPLLGIMTAPSLTFAICSNHHFSLYLYSSHHKLFIRLWAPYKFRITGKINCVFRWNCTILCYWMIFSRGGLCYHRQQIESPL